MKTPLRRGVPVLAIAAWLVSAATALAPAAAASGCGPGFVPNPFNGQCLAPVITPQINGIPCVPSNLGLCNSFVQNQQPPRKPFTAVG